MEKVIINLIKLQNQLRILHWQTSKFSEHKAFGKAYDDLDDLIDDLVEVHQGKYGKIKFGSPFEIELTSYDDISIMDVLSEVTDFLSDYVTEIHDPQKDTDCLNIRDEILALLNRLKYLLTLQ